MYSRTTVGSSRTQAPASNARQSRGYSQPTPGAADAGQRAQQAEGGQTRTLEWRGAYAVMPPNEKRRTEISRVAQEETAEFEAYKESQRVGHVSYVGTVGGQNSEAQSRRVTRVQSLAATPMQKKLADEQRRRATKELEQAQHERHKAAQRHKAEAHEESERARQRRLDDDRRRKNEAFLDKLQAQ